jgi:DNA-binding HxlR family transcriptional regulator
MSRSGSCQCCATDAEAPVDDHVHTCYCPVHGLIDTISKRYALQIIGILGEHQPLRFGEIEATLEVTSPSLLTERLNELVLTGLVDRESYAEVPPRVEYRLTSDGHELEERLRPLLEWAADHPRKGPVPGVADGH